MSDVMTNLGYLKQVTLLLLFAALMAEMTPHVRVEEGATAEICIHVTHPPTNASLSQAVSIAVRTESGTAGRWLMSIECAVRC